MKIKVGLTQSSYADGPVNITLGISLDLTEAEEEKLRSYDIPIPDKGYTTTDLCRKCWPTHGDFFREVGIHNFGTFQPDAGYFRTGNSGWRSFIVRLLSEDNREDTLRNIGVVIGRKLSLFVGKLPEVIVDGQDVMRMPQAVVQLADIKGETVDIRIGSRLYRASAIEENMTDTKLINRVKGDLEDSANLQVSGFESEYASNLSLMDKQCRSEVNKMKRQLSNRLPALAISDHLLRQGIIVTSPGNEYRIYIPIKLHYKQIATNSYIWRLKRGYQLRQQGYLMIALGAKFTYRWSWIYDMEFEDTVQLFHTAGDTLCLGSYEVKANTLDDMPGIRDDIANMLVRINTTSMMINNLSGTMMEVYEIIETNHRADFKLKGEEVYDLDLSDVAVLIKDKEDSIWE